jgi:hypothetical protein
MAYRCWRKGLFTMVVTTSATRRRRQDRLGHVYWGVALVGLGAFLMIQNRLGGLSLEPWRYWPMLLILGGLPPLLRPTDDANQAGGLFLAGTGVIFLLQTLGLVRWSFSQAWPLLLIAAGVLLLVRSRRPDEGPARNGQ